VNNREFTIKDWVVFGLTLLAVGLLFFTSPKNNKSNLSSGNNSQEIQYREDLTPQEQDILNVPFEGTEDEKRKHFELVSTVAKDSNVIDIGGCIADPIVAKISETSDLIVKNSDNTPHKILFDQNNIFDIPPNGEVVLKDIFTKGQGLYGYGCDDGRSAGLFIVTK
jgi:preprotein translocase subunit YajC